MKKVLFLMSLAGLVGCGAAEFRVAQPAVKQTCGIEDGFIVCPDGSSTPVPKDGTDGSDGSDGTDGKDGVIPVIYTEVIVPKSSCTKVGDSLWVENIEDGKFFDVYSNDKCQDSLGEYCDNVEPSYGSTGQYGVNKDGGAEVCWAESRQVSGQRLPDKSLLIRVLEF